MKPDQPHTQTERPPAPGPRPARGRWKRRAGRAALATLSAAALVLVGSCLQVPAENEAYPATDAEVSATIDRLEAEPVGLPRPVVVLSGYRSPRATASDLAERIIDLTGADPDRVLVLSYPFATTIEDPAQRLVTLVQEAFPCDDPELTSEVDVVAISMGGLVARLAADEPEHRGRPEGKELNIVRLFTLGTPHDGARLAQLIRLDPASRNMRPGSDFIEALNERADFEHYELTCYAVLHDRWVGATRSAPPGRQPIWVPGRLVLSHHLISFEDRILADLALRLRGESPLAKPSKPPRD